DHADCTLRFATATQGLRALVSRHTVSHLVAGMHEGTVSVRGNAFHLLWFADLTQRVVPLAEKIDWGTPPNAYVKPSTTIAAAKRITGETAVRELDPSWEGAMQNRAKLKMWRVAAGEPTLAF